MASIAKNQTRGQLISLAKAAQNTPYSQEYLSLLARKGKLTSKKIGRNWYTTRAAVEEYISQQGVHIVIPTHAKNKIATLASYSVALPTYSGETANPESAETSGRTAKSEPVKTSG